MAKLVLIIDDEEDLIEYLQELIETLDLNIDVIFATGGQAGIDKVKENLNDLELVFLDMIMPDVSGLQVYQEIRELSDDLKIIFMSGFPLSELSTDENVYFLEKPFDLEQIERVLEKISQS